MLVEHKIFLLTSQEIGGSNHWRCSARKGVIRNLAKFTENYLCQRLWHNCFPVNFTKFLSALFLWNTSGGCFSIALRYSFKIYYEQTTAGARHRNRN